MVPGEHALVRVRGWPAAELAEAALAIGEHEHARRAVADALRRFERLGDTRGMRYARDLQLQLEQQLSGC